MKNKYINIIFSIILVITVGVISLVVIRSHKAETIEETQPVVNELTTEELTTIRPDGFYMENNKWHYYENGASSVRTDAVYGNINGEQGKWYLKNGAVDFSYNSLIKKEKNLWWYIKNGRVSEETDETIALKINENFKETKNEDTFAYYGNFSLTEDEIKTIEDAVKAVENKGHKIGFCLYDLNSLQGFSYNADEKIYSASTLKGPYVASIVSDNNELLEKEKVRINAVLKNSSNFDYEGLRSKYGDESLVKWAEKAGSDVVIDAVRDYQFITPRQLSDLWISNYIFFESNETGKKLGKLFENPATSPINKVLSGDFVTRTKAGWVTKNNTKVTNDAGLVYVGEKVYLLCVMTTAPCDFKVVEDFITEMRSAITLYQQKQ